MYRIKRLNTYLRALFIVRWFIELADDDKDCNIITVWRIWVIYFIFCFIHSLFFSYSLFYFGRVMNFEKKKSVSTPFTRKITWYPYGNEENVGTLELISVGHRGEFSQMIRVKHLTVLVFLLLSCQSMMNVLLGNTKWLMLICEVIISDKLSHSTMLFNDDRKSADMCAIC